MLSVSQAVVVYNLGKFMSCFPCPFVIFLSVTGFFCVCAEHLGLGKNSKIEICSQFYERN